jgi:proteasome lid subunit RPN8/RPN11
LADFREQRGFQLNDISQSILDEIKKYCLQNKQEESCGLIYSESDKLIWVACENIAKNKTFNFMIDPRKMIDYDVRYVVHSHCTGGSNASILDKKIQAEICIPFLIYSIEDDKFSIYDNISV